MGLACMISMTTSYLLYTHTYSHNKPVAHSRNPPLAGSLIIIPDGGCSWAKCWLRQAPVLRRAVKLYANFLATAS
jgi:hypothetical protein